MSLTALALALQISGDPAPAAASPPQAPAPATKVKDADPVECREDVVTGSHFSARTCRRHSEWMRLRDGSLEALGQRGRDRQAGGFKPN